MTQKDFQRSQAEACGLHVQALHLRDGSLGPWFFANAPAAPALHISPCPLTWTKPLPWLRTPFHWRFPSIMDAKALKPAKGQPPEKAGAGGGGEDDSGWPTLQSRGMEQRPAHLPGPQAFLSRWGWIGPGQHPGRV